MIQVIHRAFDILELLAQDLHKEYGLREIANTLNLNHGTCANILKTMINRGYVEKKKGYSLGPSAYYLTNNFSNKNELLKVATGPMKALEDNLNESCVLAILKNDKRIVLHKEVSSHELQANTRDEKNAYQTATGRILLAFMSPDEQALYVKTYGLPGVMWPEVSDEKDLATEFTKIREKGIAIHHADSEIIGVGVPVFNKHQVIASMGVYLPESRFKVKTQELIYTALKEAAKTSSEEMGRYR